MHAVLSGKLPEGLDKMIIVDMSPVTFDKSPDFEIYFQGMSLITRKGVTSLKEANTLLAPLIPVRE